MTTKEISRLVVLAAVVITCVSVLFKLITGAISMVSALGNVILGVIVVVALVVIVVWMFAYAKKMGKKKDDS